MAHVPQARVCLHATCADGAGVQAFKAYMSIAVHLCSCCVVLRAVVLNAVNCYCHHVRRMHAC